MNALSVNECKIFSWCEVISWRAVFGEFSKEFLGLWKEDFFRRGLRDMVVLREYIEETVVSWVWFRGFSWGLDLRISVEMRRSSVTFLPSSVR